MKTLIVAAIALVASLSGAVAQTSVAIVEDVQGKVDGVEFMDYVTRGQVIKLGATDTIVLGYVNSCVRETITGGVVTVGADQSAVESGKVQRAKVSCGNAQAELSNREAGQGAATAFRSIPLASASKDVPQLMKLYGLSPIIEVSQHGSLIVERVDVPGERHLVVLGPYSLVKGKFFDFAQHGKVLKAGGTYAATLGDKKTVFYVDRNARQVGVPVVGRLLRL